MIHVCRRVCLYVIHGHFFSLYYHSLPHPSSRPQQPDPDRSSAGFDTKPKDRIQNGFDSGKRTSSFAKATPKERKNTHTDHLRGEWFIADEFPSDGGIITFPLPIPQHTHTQHTLSRPRVSVCAIDWWKMRKFDIYDTRPFWVALGKGCIFSPHDGRRHRVVKLA